MRSMTVFDVHDGDGRPVAVHRFDDECSVHMAEMRRKYHGYIVDGVWPFVATDGTCISVVHMVPPGARA